MALQKLKNHSAFIESVINNPTILTDDGLFVKFNDIPKSVEDEHLAPLILKGISVVIYKKENSDVYLQFKKVSKEYNKFSEIPGSELVKYNMMFTLEHGDPEAKIRPSTFVLPVLWVYLMEEDSDIIDIYSKRFLLKDIISDLEENIPINITDEQVTEHPTYGRRLWTVFGNYTMLPKEA